MKFSIQIHNNLKKMYNKHQLINKLKVINKAVILKNSNNYTEVSIKVDNT